MSKPIRKEINTALNASITLVKDQQDKTRGTVFLPSLIINRPLFERIFMVCCHERVPGPHDGDEA